MFLVRFTLLALLLNFAATAAFAQNSPPVPYALMLFENDHFRNFTYEEIKAKISINQDVIDLNICNGKEKLLLPDLNQTQKKIRLKS